MSVERKVRSPSPSLFMPRPTAMTIFVFANKCTRARKFELTKFDLLAYNPTLDFIARMIGMRAEGGIKSLYSVIGKKINGSRDLENGGAYVGVSGHERFRRMEYNDGACNKFGRELRAVNEKTARASYKEKGLPRIAAQPKQPLLQEGPGRLNQFYGNGHVLESSRDFRNNYRRITGNQIETPSTSGHNSLSPTISLPCMSQGQRHDLDRNTDAVTCRNVHSNNQQRHLSANAATPPALLNQTANQNRSFYRDVPANDRHISPTGRTTPSPPPHPHKDKAPRYVVERKHGERNISPTGHYVPAYDVPVKKHQNKDVTFYKEAQPYQKKRNRSPNVNQFTSSSPLRENNRDKMNPGCLEDKPYRSDKHASPRGHCIASTSETLPNNKKTVQSNYDIGLDSTQNQRYVSPHRRRTPPPSFRDNESNFYHEKLSFYEDIPLRAKRNHRNLSSCSSQDCVTTVALPFERNIKAHSYNTESSVPCCREQNYNSDMLLYRGVRPERKSPVGRRKRSRSAGVERYERLKSDKYKLAIPHFQDMEPTRERDASPPAARTTRSPFVTPPDESVKRQRRSIDVDKESHPTVSLNRRQRRRSSHKLPTKSPVAVALPHLDSHAVAIPFYNRVEPKRKQISVPLKHKPMTPDPLQAKQALYQAKGVPYYSAIYSLERTKKSPGCEKQQFNTNPLPKSSKKKTQFFMRSFDDERANADVADTLKSQFHMLKMKREEYVPWSADTEHPVETSQTMIETPYMEGNDYYSLLYQGDQGDLHVGKKEKQKKDIG